MTELTVKQAVAHLATTDKPYTLSTIRKAIEVGKLKAEKDIDHPPYLLINLDDLIAWANDPDMHRDGPKPKGQTE